MNALKDDLDYNIDIHVKFIRKAAKEKCQLVMFPELSATAHFGDEQVVRFAERAGAGPTFETIAAQAAKLGIIVSYGFCEFAHGTHFNSQAVVGPGGLMGVQRKVHASKDEYFCFRMGRSLEVLDLGFCRIGTLICYDSDFCEAWRVLALKGAEVILLPHAWRTGWGKDLGKKTMIASLKSMLSVLPVEKGVYTKDNAVFSIFGNQVGFNGHSTHGGGAFILDPLGNVLAKTPVTLRDRMVTAVLDPTVLDKARRSPFYTLKTRRPELYDEIAKAI